MFKIIFIVLFLFMNISFAKEISLEVLASSGDVTAEMNEDQLLLINGYRQAITSELLELKLDSELFWNKLEQKKMSTKEEAEFLKNIFENSSLARPVQVDAKESIPEGSKIKLSGHFSAAIDLEKLKRAFLEVTTDLAETKLKTFYLLANIDLDDSMTWNDVGVQKPESFRGVVLDSWKKLIEKDIKGFEKVSVLDKDLSTKPDYMNTKSVTLKWTSTFKKVANNSENISANYELSAQYVLQNAKSGAVLLAFDFPIQKRDFDTQNKKALSSSLASLVYNLLLSQVQKINNIVLANAAMVEPTEVEIKIVSKAGLTEIYQINSFLQEKFKNLKLTSQMKSYSSDGSTLSIRAESSMDKIYDILSAGGGKFPLNEQKVLIFNRADKTFAILPKEPNI